MTPTGTNPPEGVRTSVMVQSRSNHMSQSGFGGPIPTQQKDQTDRDAYLGYYEIPASQAQATNGALSATQRQTIYPDSAGNVPDGFYAKAFKLEFIAVTVGSVGAGTDHLSALMNRLRIMNENNDLVVDVTGQALHAVYYDGVLNMRNALHAAPKTSFVDQVLVGNASYYALFPIVMAAKGRHFKATIDFNPATVLSGYAPTPTSCAIQASLSVVCDSQKPPKYEVLRAASLPVSSNKVDFPDVFSDKDPSVDAITLLSQAEWSGITTGITIGPDSPNNAQVVILEDNANEELVGSSPAGALTTVGNFFFPALLDPTDPAGTAVLYMIHQRLPKAGTASVTLNTPTNILAVARRFVA